MKKLLSILCVGILSVCLFAGCSNNNESKDKISKLESELKSTKQELTDANEKIKELEKAIEENELVVLEDFQDPKRVLNIVAMGINYERLTEGMLISDGLDVEENIEVILDVVSARYFEKHTIKLIEIENINDKKVAVIDLAGDSEYWYGRMQGTTGGSITTYNLIQNVLQVKYEGEWIDGVKFLVDGKPCNEMQHAVEISEITYR